MRYFQLCLILNIIVYSAQYYTSTKEECRRSCCPFVHRWDSYSGECYCPTEIADTMTGCYCSIGEFMNCISACNRPEADPSGFERRYWWVCELNKDDPICRCQNEVPGLISSLLENEKACQHDCCPKEYRLPNQHICSCIDDEDVANPEITCACSDEEVANCKTSCNPNPPGPGIANKYAATCTLQKGAQCTCFKLDEGPLNLGYDGRPCYDFDCQDICCPKFGACDSDYNFTCTCVEGMEDSVAMYCNKGVECQDLECQNKCCPKWGACSSKIGACNCVDGMDDLPSVQRYCRAETTPCSEFEVSRCNENCQMQYGRTDYPSDIYVYGECKHNIDGGTDCSCQSYQVTPANPPPSPCNDHQCQISCCPKWGACDPQTGGCYCMGGTEELQEVKRQCAPGGKPCTEAEVESCQLHCLLSPEESGYAFVFSECTRGSDGSAQCNCQPYQG